MHLVLIATGVIIAIILIWLLVRKTSDESTETIKTVLSSDMYTKILLGIIALTTSIIALQGFLN